MSGYEDNGQRGGARNAKQASLLASAQSRPAHVEQAPDQAQTQRTAPDASSSTRPSSPRSRARNRQAAGRESLPEFLRRNATYVISVLAVVIIVALMLVFLRGCIPQESAPVEEKADKAISYDWTKLDRTDGRFAYVENGQVLSKLGIDVSENQGAIDWATVADAGIDFAIIRLGYRGATEGELYLDAHYAENIANAKAAGIERGIYFFSQARTEQEAIEEADFVLESLNGEALEYPIAFDSEEAVLGVDVSRTSGLDNDTMTAVAEAFCKRVEEAGYRSLVYGNAYDLSRYHAASMADNALWWAEYNTPSPTVQFPVFMWQYSNAGYIPGIDVAVDMNIDLSGIQPT